MMEIAVAILVIGEILLVIAKAVSGIVQFLKRKEEPERPPLRDWYGYCEKCGKLDGLHRFQGKKYCAWCHARIKTESDLAKKKQKDSAER